MSGTIADLAFEIDVTDDFHMGKQTDAQFESGIPWFDAASSIAPDRRLQISVLRQVMLSPSDNELGTISEHKAVESLFMTERGTMKFLNAAPILLNLSVRVFHPCGRAQAH